MTRRIYKSRFGFYIFWIALPFLLGGAFLAFYPDPIFPHLVPGSSGEFSGTLRLSTRICGTLFLYTGVTLLFMRREPDRNRELAFWQAILCFALAGLLGSSPWLSGMSYWTLPIALYLLASGIFLFAFASRNLLVRE
jgi:hypothetical protein